jgi:hypothetical protein
MAPFVLMRRRTAMPGLLEALNNKGFHNHPVRDKGVAGSNPATPTSSTNKALIALIFLPTLSI